jgi:hypothetical protein
VVAPQQLAVVAVRHQRFTAFVSSTQG